MTKEDLLRITINNLYLSKKNKTCIELAEQLCGMQAQYFNNVLYSILIRCGSKSVEGWNTSLVKTWTLRGTLHAVPMHDLPIYNSLSKNGAYITKCGIDSDLLNNVAEEVMKYIEKGIGNRSELKKIFDKKLNNKQLLNQLFSSWGGVLGLLASQGRIVYSSVSSRSFVPLPEQKIVNRSEAVEILVKRYFRNYGPASYADAAKFLGLKQVEIIQFSEKLDNFQELTIDQKKYYYINSNEDLHEIPKIIFLAGFDPLIIGYKDTSRILPEEYIRNIITLTGIIKPSIVLNGKVCATWTIKSKKLFIDLS